MPLPLTVSCFSKIQIGFTFLVPAHLGSPGKRAVKRVSVLFTKDKRWKRLTSANDAQQQYGSNGEVAGENAVRQHCQSSHRQCQRNAKQLNMDNDHTQTTVTIVTVTALSANSDFLQRIMFKITKKFVDHSNF